MKGVPIKFRARRCNSGEYVYGQYLEILGADNKVRGTIILKKTFNETIYEFVYKDTVEQLCGYDAEGNEVYEGDELTYTECIEEDEDYEDEIEYKGKAYLAVSWDGDIEVPFVYLSLKK